MQRHQQGNIEWLTFELLEDLSHGVFFHPPHLPNSVSLKQQHGTRVVEANSNHQEGDALITNQPNLPLVVRHADCQAAIFYDPIHRAIANVHCGWRGNVQNIYRETIVKMGKCYSTHPGDLLVGISPSICPAEFRNYRSELPKSFWRFQTEPTYFDLWEISKWQLMECGVLPQHIEIAEICTYSNSEFYSYRRDHTSKRHATVVSLQPPSTRRDFTLSILSKKNFDCAS